MLNATRINVTSPSMTVLSQRTVSIGATVETPSAVSTATLNGAGSTHIFHVESYASLKLKSLILEDGAVRNCGCASFQIRLHRLRWCCYLRRKWRLAGDGFVLRARHGWISWWWGLWLYRFDTDNTHPIRNLRKILQQTGSTFQSNSAK